MVIKQIYFDENTGRLMLSDNDNNHYLCNLYGDKLTEFLPGVSGIASQRERGISVKSKFEISNKQYLPCIRFFEGYSHFPRPKVPPFENLKANNKQKLINTLVKNFKCDKVLELFNVKTNIGLNYLTAQLVKDESKINRIGLIRLIDNYFEEYQQVNKNRLNLMAKDPIIKSLKRFKKLLNENIEINVIHGRELNQPSDYIKRKYYEVKNKLKCRKKHSISDKSKPYNILTSESVKDDMSFLSQESDNHNRCEENNILNVKDNMFFKKSIETEKKYIEGFKIPVKKEEGIIHKAVKTQFKTNGQLYLQDLELFKRGIIIVN
jgi:hypothetical protein